MKLHDDDIEILKMVKSIIDKDLSRHLTINQLTRQVATGATKLKKMFKQYYGIGIYSYLLQARMEQAKTLILTTPKTMKQIAKLSGYKYYSNFIVAFTHYHGITPGAIRKKFES